MDISFSPSIPTTYSGTTKYGILFINNIQIYTEGAYDLNVCINTVNLCKKIVVNIKNYYINAIVTPKNVIEN